MRTLFLPRPSHPPVLIHVLWPLEMHNIQRRHQHPHHRYRNARGNEMHHRARSVHTPRIGHGCNCCGAACSAACAAVLRTLTAKCGSSIAMTILKSWQPPQMMRCTDLKPLMACARVCGGEGSGRGGLSLCQVLLDSTVQFSTAQPVEIVLLTLLNSGRELAPCTCLVSTLMAPSCDAIKSCNSFSVFWKAKKERGRGERTRTRGCRGEQSYLPVSTNALRTLRYIQFQVSWRSLYPSQHTLRVLRARERL